MNDVMKDYQAQQEGLMKRIERTQGQAMATLDRIGHDGAMMEDFLLSLGQHSGVQFASNGDVKMEVHKDDGTMADFRLHRNAIIQTGSRLGMPVKFIEQLAHSPEQWQRDLIAYNLNRYTENTTRQRVLVRTVEDEVRGVLSDYYKRIDSNLLFRTYLETTEALDMQLIDANYDGLTSYVESVHPQVFTVPTPKNGNVFMAFGARMRSGEFGNSPFELSLFAFQVVCYNGMQTESAIKEIHRGSRLPDNIDFAKDTLLADTKRATKIARDAIKTIMKPDAIEKYMAQMQNASAEVIDVEKELKTLAKGGKVNKTEMKTLESVITGNRPQDGVAGENTLWKLSQAVGRVGALSKDGKRKRELDELANSLIQKANK